MAAKKVMVIGLDAAIAPNVYRYAREGHMPRVKHLLENGVCAINSYPPFPSITPPSWTTLATGATSATHGVPCFNVHVPGTGLDDMDQAFDSNLVQAEFISKAFPSPTRDTWPTAWGGWTCPRSKR
jgi:predicted AlkP superfamily phosphohydrolase/phosphomutase